MSKKTAPAPKPKHGNDKTNPPGGKFKPSTGRGPLYIPPRRQTNP